MVTRPAEKALQQHVSGLGCFHVRGRGLIIPHERQFYTGSRVGHLHLDSVFCSTTSEHQCTSTQCGVMREAYESHRVNYINTTGCEVGI
jgi:hypothetical protein